MEPTHGRGFHSLRARSVSENVSNRLLNVVLAALLLGITGPLLLIVALVIRCESPGPVLDNRASINREGRRFMALTFRTTEHAEGRIWSGPDMTRVGWFLIYTRIVSLPKLINVVLGDISLSEIEDHSAR